MCMCECVYVCVCLRVMVMYPSAPLWMPTESSTCHSHSGPFKQNRLFHCLRLLILQQRNGIC